ncbi:MAG TPA: hypothetical protein VJJ23_03615 [Candidatus Nanoarchaeia archaeon]|nr:hypothetical protein [Candidatus Nanoarchaeia archaeon]
MTVAKINIKPTNHYLLEHSDVGWDLVIMTILSPTKTHPNKRLGKDRFTYIKKFKKYIIEIHTKNDNINNVIWVINAFRNWR